MAAPWPCALALALQVADLQTQELRVLAFPLQPGPERGRHGGAVPEAHRGQAGPDVPPLRHPDALGGQQSLHAIRHPRALLLHRPQLAMELAPILVLDRGHAHHAPDVALARVVTPQQADQLAGVQPIRLRPPQPSIHFDARRVHHRVFDPYRGQVPVQPEAVTPGLVAAPHGAGRLQAEPLLGVPDLPRQPVAVSRRHRPQSRPRPRLGRESKLPLLDPQLEGHVQARRAGSGILGSAGRSGPHRRGSSLLVLAEQG